RFVMAGIMAAIGFLAAPAAIVWMCRKAPFARRFEPIVLCYAAGLLGGLSGLLPESVSPARTQVAEASVGLALPLLLFAVNVHAWRRVAGRAMLSMFLAVTAVVAVSVALFHVFAARGTEAPEQLSGMAVGMYTGGIPNMGAIKLALGIPDARYILFATADTVVGALYVLFIITVAPTFFRRLLPPFPRSDAGADAPAPQDAAHRQPAVVAGLIALAAAAVCVGLAVVLAPLLSFMDPRIGVI